MRALTDRVRGALRKRDVGRALEVLLEDWAKAPSESVAAAIDAVDARLDAPGFAGETKAWLAAAKSSMPRDRGPLLRAIPGHTGASTLAMIKRAVGWRDPRLTHVFAQLLRALPWSGKRSRAVWRQIFALLGKHGDARFIPIAAQLPATWKVGQSLQVWLTNQLVTATSALAPGRADPELAALIAELQVAAPPPAQTPQTANALLAAIYRDPDDDAPRQVYADWLQDRGDVRGELIALQLGGIGDRTREHALIKEHKKSWLGPLANILRGEVEFRRGFPASAIVTFRNQREVEQYGSLVEWATIDELEFGSAIVRHDQRAWSKYVGPAMRNLQILRRADVTHVLASNVPWHRLHTLELAAADVTTAQVAQLARSPITPKLARLAIYGWLAPDWIAGLKVCPPHLALSGGLEDDRLTAALAAAQRSGLQSMSLREYGGAMHRFTRDESGAFTRLDIEVHPPTKTKTLDPLPHPLPKLVTALRALPRRSLTHFDAQVELGGKLVPAKPLFDAAKRALQ